MSTERKHSLGGCLECINEIELCEEQIEDLTIRAQKAERERDEANAQMCQAIGHLSDVAETCQDWLDSIIQEPAVDFIKAIRDWSKKKAAST
jgi:hypothetical protein